jgi:hypothetical protein
MDDKIKQIKGKYSHLVFEKKENLLFGEDEDQERFHYVVSGFDGSADLRIMIRNERRLEQLSDFLRREIFIFPDFIAARYDDKIEVLLSPISFRTLRFREADDGAPVKILEVSIHYFKNELKITIEVRDNPDLISTFLSMIPLGKRYLRKAIVLRIDNYVKPTAEGVVNDTRNILNSILFDIEFNYGLIFETISLSSLFRRLKRKRLRYSEIPDEKINLVYKKYIPELIQYFHLAEKVDYLPFKFVCYYHIIEYFSDKSAYHLVSNEVKRLLLKPDFHINTDNYVNQAINLFKKENDKYTGDKIKIERVLKQFINRDDLKDTLNNYGILEYFTKEVMIDCVKPLKLPAINFEQDGSFFSELTKRIYSMRCSIVHSNPDFDEAKAVPFSATTANLEKLKFEIDIISEIARKIIVNSKG